jgi:mRNA-degrading endonuclease toxin of MazEF toxin-antitoxin module
MTPYKWGDIVSVRLDETGGGEARYALVISADILNDNLSTVIVCPLIEAKGVAQSRAGATFIPVNEIGLDFDSLVLSLQIKTINKERIIRRISSLPAHYEDEIRESLQAVLSLD